MEKINIAELLKDCPRDIELDCVLSEDVILDDIDMSSNYPIKIIIGGKLIEYLSPEGCLSSIHYTNHKKAKCVIFPKGKTTWEGFQRPFKDGDILVYKNKFNNIKYTFIYKRRIDMHYLLQHCGWFSEKPPFSEQFNAKERIPLYENDDIKFATEEEKAKLFQAIKDNGYMWNEETNTLEKLPKFKVGDVVVDDSGAIFLYRQIHTYYEEPYADFYCGLTSEFRSFVIKTGEAQRCGKISSIRFATEEEKQKLFDAIKENGYRWNAETKTLEKLNVPSTTEKFYIRIGDIPSEEKSSVYRGDAVVGYEEGVSVYDCVETDGLYRIVMPFPLKEGQGMTYECLIQEITQCRYEIEKPRNVYLVSGIEVGKGHDNEPLIKDVKILKDLTEQFNAKNDNTEENKTLEKLVKPMFNVGDRIKRIKTGNIYEIIKILSNCYITNYLGSDITILFNRQDEYELVPNKFDINTLKPFESKVLVRDYDDKIWVPTFWGKLLEDDSNCRYLTTNGCYKYCIPYNEETKHLTGTTNDCDEYFKTWKS